MVKGNANGAAGARWRHKVQLGIDMLVSWFQSTIIYRLVAYCTTRRRAPAYGSASHDDERAESASAPSGLFIDSTTAIDVGERRQGMGNQHDAPHADDDLFLTFEEELEMDLDEGLFTDEVQFDDDDDASARRRDAPARIAFNWDVLKDDATTSAYPGQRDQASLA